MTRVTLDFNKRTLAFSIRLTKFSIWFFTFVKTDESHNISDLMAQTITIGIWSPAEFFGTLKGRNCQFDVYWRGATISLVPGNFGYYVLIISIHSDELLDEILLWTLISQYPGAREPPRRHLESCEVISARLFDSKTPFIHTHVYILLYLLLLLLLFLLYLYTLMIHTVPM